LLLLLHTAEENRHTINSNRNIDGSKDNETIILHSYPSFPSYSFYHTRINGLHESGLSESGLSKSGLLESELFGSGLSESGLSESGLLESGLFGSQLNGKDLINFSKSETDNSFTLTANDKIRFRAVEDGCADALDLLCDLLSTLSASGSYIYNSIIMYLYHPTQTLNMTSI
jgi:hypothetical protein